MKYRKKINRRPLLSAQEKLSRLLLINSLMSHFWAKFDFSLRRE